MPSDDISSPLFSQFLKFDPYSRKPNSFISYIQHQFLTIHSTHLDFCVNTVDDTILMVVTPWFSSEARKDFRNWENDGEKDFQDKANKASLVGWI